MRLDFILPQLISLDLEHLTAGEIFLNDFWGGEVFSSLSDHSLLLLFAIHSPYIYTYIYNRLLWSYITLEGEVKLWSRTRYFNGCYSNQISIGFHIKSKVSEVTNEKKVSKSLVLHHGSPWQLAICQMPRSQNVKAYYIHHSIIYIYMR